MALEDEIISWSDDLSTGIDWQDKQHKTLVDQINRLHNEEDNLEAVFAFTKNYATTHFRDEEAMMVHYGYPHTKEHQEEHEFFVDSVQKLDVTEKSDSEIRRELLVELSAWLIWHIKNSDYEQSAWLKENTNCLDHSPSEFYEELKREA